MDAGSGRPREKRNRTSEQTINASIGRFGILTEQGFSELFEVTLPHAESNPRPLPHGGRNDAVADLNPPPGLETAPATSISSQARDPALDDPRIIGESLNESIAVGSLNTEWIDLSNDGPGRFPEVMGTDDSPDHGDSSFFHLPDDGSDVWGYGDVDPSAFPSPPRAEEDLLVLENPAERSSYPTNELNGPPKVASATRLARSFLMGTDHFCAENINRLAEIISANGWSAAQVQIRALISRGCSIREIHWAWQIRELWKDSPHLHSYTEELLTRTPHHTSLLTWLQAILLVEHFDLAQQPEEVIAYLDELFSHWCSHPELRVKYPVFKDYLFSYRLSKVDRKHDLGMQVNLDPIDDRTFDGYLNEAQDDWWHGNKDDWDGAKESQKARELWQLLYVKE